MPTLLRLGWRKIAYNYKCINKTPLSLVGLVLTLFLTIILLYKILIYDVSCIKK